MDVIPNLSQFVSNITALITTTVETVLVLIVIILGVQFILYAGNPNERSKLVHRIIWIVVGLFIIVGAQNFTGLLNALVSV
ncbi:TrbC/VirB2 family protein [Patescibacteria group bacterium]|nr:TrbC/VirB2 family protein [Patescibacteria group bacterium]